jgi:hypothetical protein
MWKVRLSKGLVFGGQLALYGYFLARYGTEALTPLFLFAPATFGASFAGFAAGRKWSTRSSTCSRP